MFIFYNVRANVNINCLLNDLYMQTIYFNSLIQNALLAIFSYRMKRYPHFEKNNCLLYICLSKTVYHTSQNKTKTKTRLMHDNFKGTR